MATAKPVGTATGFTTVSKPAKRRIIMSIEGMEGSGKNNLAFTAPGDIYFHSFDFGDDGVIQKFMHKKKIHRAEYSLEIKPGTAIQLASETARPVWSKFCENFTEGLKKGRSTIVDTATDAYEVVRMVEHGKLTQVMPHHYTPVNQAMKALWREAYNSDSNLIMLHRMKEVWDTKVVNGKEVSNRTGRWELAGYGGTPFEAQVCIRVYKVAREVGDNGFRAIFTKCRQNPELEGMELSGDMLSIPIIGQMVFPESEEKEWL